MSTPPASPAQPHRESDWPTDNPQAEMPAVSPPEQGNQFPHKYALTGYTQDGYTRTQPTYTAQDYIQDDTWEGAAVAPTRAGYGSTAKPRARRRSPSVARGLLVLLALLVVAALATVVAVLPGVRDAVAPALGTVDNTVDSGTASEAPASSPSNDISVVQEPAADGIAQNGGQIAAANTPSESSAGTAKDEPNVGIAGQAEANNTDTATADAPSGVAAADNAAINNAAEENSAGDSSAEITPAENAAATTAANERVASTPSAAQLFTQATNAFASEQWVQAVQFYEQVRALDVGYQQERGETDLVVAYNNAAAELLADEVTDVSTAESALQLYRSALALDAANETAKTQSERLNNFIVGNRAQRLGDANTAIERLQPYASEANSTLRALAAQRLYEAYLLLGDEAMRAGAVGLAMENFNEAALLAVSDPSALVARLTSLERLALVDQSLLNAEAQTLIAATQGASSPAISNAVAEANLAAVAEETAVPVATSMPTPTPEVAAAPLTETDVATETAAVVATAQPALTRPTCPDGRAMITQPLANQAVSGPVAVIGSVTHEEFGFYKLEFSRVGENNVAWFAGGDAPVINGSLGVWDSSLQPNGDYIIRLTSVDNLGNYPPPCEVQVRVQN